MLALWKNRKTLWAVVISQCTIFTFMIKYVSIFNVHIAIYLSISSKNLHIPVYYTI